jgi:glycosyltransferase involved in cell wall biosynthesis
MTDSEMDVAFVNRSLGMRRGGGEIWDLEMARALSSKGINVTIYTGKPLTGGLKKPVDLPVETVSSPFLYDLGYAAPIGVGGVITDLDRYLFSVQLRRHLDEHDIVHLNAYPELLRISSDIDAPMTIKLNGPPHSLFYDYIHPWKSSYSWLDRAEAVVTTGMTTDTVRSETDIEPIVINPGVDTERFFPDGPEVEASNPTVLWVGRFVPAKNLTDLIDAFARVLDEYPNAELWLVGEGPLRAQIESWATEREIQDVITFCGYIPNDELPQYYRAADVFTLSSKTENHPIALMEAMSCGTPVVAPKIGWIPEMVENRSEGYLVSPNDPDKVADALLYCLDRIGVFAQSARAKAVSEFSWSERAMRLQRLFEDVSKHSPTRTRV